MSPSFVKNIFMALLAIAVTICFVWDLLRFKFTIKMSSMYLSSSYFHRSRFIPKEQAVPIICKYFLQANSQACHSQPNLCAQLASIKVSKI